MIPPRSARAQKVVFDDPKGLRIYERDTPFRQFFTERTQDFKDVDYAKTTILGDILARLENRTYVRKMIEEVVERHRDHVILAVASEAPPAVVATASGKKSDEEKAQEKREKDQQAKALKEQQKKDRESRAKLLAQAIHRLFSELGYPYVDDQDIDDILTGVTGLRHDTWDKKSVRKHWPYHEAHEAWHRMVGEPGVRPEGAEPSDMERDARVRDFIRDLHLTLHDREFFRSVIDDAASHRKDLFQGSSASFLGLTAAKEAFNKFIRERLDADQRKAAAEGAESMWAAFVEDAFDGNTSPLRDAAQDDRERSQFVADVRKSVLDATKDKPKLEAKDLAAAFRSALVSDDKDRRWLRPGSAGAAAAFKPLFEAAEKDADVLAAFATLAKHVDGPLKEALSAETTARGKVPAPDGTATSNDEESILDPVRGKATAFNDRIELLQLGDWIKRVDPENTGGAVWKLVRAGDGQPALQAAAATLTNALLEVEKLVLLSQLRSAKTIQERLIAMHRGSAPFDREKPPVQSVRAAYGGNDDGFDAAFAAAVGEMPESDQPFYIALLKADRERVAALAALHDDLRDQQLKGAAEDLHELDSARNALARSRTVLEQARARADELVDELMTPTKNVMESANGALATERRQDVEAIVKAATGVAKTILRRRAADAESLAAGEVGGLLESVFIGGAKADVKASLDQVVVTFRRVFGKNRGLLASDAPILKAFAETADLGAHSSKRSSAASAVATAIAAELGKESVQTELKGDPDGDKLVALTSAAVEKPGVSFQFSKPGSAKSIDAFKSEFFQAFKHRLGEATTAERAPDYDYWWLTLYPKAMPIADESFVGESVVQVEFPEQVVPKEEFERWTMDFGSLEEVDCDVSSRRIDRVAMVLSSLLEILDAPGLAGQHDTARAAVLDGMRALRRNKQMSEHAAVMGAIDAIQAHMFVGSGYGKIESSDIQAWVQEARELRKGLRERRDCRQSRQRLCESLQASGMSRWYLNALRDLDRSDLKRLDDMIEFGSYLSEPLSAEPSSIRRHAATRAASRAPFGVEHILVAVLSAYQDAATLPVIVELYTNAFFDGVGRFEGELTAGREGSDASRFAGFLGASGISAWRDGAAKPCPCDPVGEELLKLVECVRQTGVGSAKQSHEFLRSGPPREASARVHELQLSAIDRAFERLEPGVCQPWGVCIDGYSWRIDAWNSRNPYLSDVRLWGYERIAAVAEAELRRIIVHSFRSRYPGVPSGAELRREYWSNGRNLQACVYRLLRSAWRVAEVDGLLDDSGVRRLRIMLMGVLTSGDLLPVGVAKELVGRIADRTAGSTVELRDWLEIVHSSPTAVELLRERLLEHLYPGLWHALEDLSQLHPHHIEWNTIHKNDYEAFVRIAQPQLQPGVQVVDLLPASRDDLVSMSINEGGTIAQIAGQADVAATYDANELALLADVVQGVVTSGTESSSETTDDDGTKRTSSSSILDRLDQQKIGTESMAYSLRGTAQGDVYSRARAAMAYSRRKEYLDAAITAAGRGDRFGKWIIRPSDLRSELAGTDGSKLVAAAHSGYPNGDQPFHMLVKVPHRATHTDWAGRKYLYFNSSYAATNESSWTRNGGLGAALVQGLMYVINYPWVDGALDRAVGVKYPFQWDVDSSKEQRELFETPNMLGGRIELDSTDKINYSDVKKLLDAEAGFIATTRSKQTESLGRVMGELVEERGKIGEAVREQIRKRVEDARAAVKPATEGDG